MFSLSTGHYLNCPVQRCTHEHLSTAYFMQCNSPQSLFFPPQVFLSACPILNRSSGSRTLVVKSTSALPCNLFEWQYLIYSLRRGGSLCVGGVVGGREGGGAVVQLCTNIKEHSSKVLTKHCHVVSLLLSLFQNSKCFFVCFLETICWPPEQPQALHEHFTFCLLRGFYLLNGHKN